MNSGMRYRSQIALTQVLDQLLSRIYGFDVGSTRGDTPVHTISRAWTEWRKGADHRRMDHAAGRMLGSISFNLGLHFPALTLRWRCFFISSIWVGKKSVQIK
jgi:hypothetical protein